MDPLTAFGLACNVIQVIDFSIKTVRKCIEIAKSAEGATDANLLLEEDVNILNNRNTELKELLDRETTTASHESQELRKLAQRCSDTVKELQELLADLKVDKSNRLKHFAVLRKSFQSHFAKGRLHDLESRLSRYQVDINSQVLLDLRKDTREWNPKLDNISKRLDAISDLGSAIEQLSALQLEEDKSDLSVGDRYRREVVQWMKDEQRKAFFAWLGPFNHNEAYESCKACRTTDTCAWIFDKAPYTEWVSSNFPRETAKILWISGPAGFGKSVLCSAIVEALEQENSIGLAHLFYKAATQPNEGSDAIPKAWVAQLVNQDIGLIETAKIAMRESPAHASKTAVWNLLTLFLQTQKQYVLVVDGLDECDLNDSNLRTVSSDRTHFLVQLQKAVEKTKCRVLIMSRDEPDIRHRLVPIGPRVNDITLLEYRILKSDVQRDNLVFARSIVEMRLPNKDESIRGELAVQMADKCEGMFLWLDLQGYYLRGGKSKRQLLQIVQEMAPDLHTVYQKSWTSILSKPEYDKTRAINIVRWVTFGVRPLTVAEITEALVIANDDTCQDLEFDNLPDCIDEEYIDDEIMGLCGSFVVLQDAAIGRSENQSLSLMTLHLKHFTVRRFLLTNDEARRELSDAEFDAALDSHIQNNHLATACLRYLQYETVQNALKAPECGRPLLDYAVTSWHQHLSNSGHRYHEAVALVNKFFDTGSCGWDNWRSRFEQLWRKNSWNYLENDAWDQRGNSTPYYYAAWFGLEETVSYCHSKNPEMLNYIGGLYGTPIQAACVRGETRLVKILFEYGSNINIATGYFGSPLGAAVSNGDFRTCKYLVEKGSKTNLPGWNGKTPLYIASQQGNVDILKLLLDNGADPSITYTRDDWASNLIASLDGGLGFLKLLLESAEPSITTNDKLTPLYVASWYGSLEVVKLLLNNGADPSTTTNDGLTPLYVASRKGYLEVVKLLLDNGADPLSTTNDGLTPLYIASKSGNLEVVKLLLKSGADLSVADNSWETPIFAASSEGHVEIVKLLLERGADIEAGDAPFTPIYLASRYGHVEVVKLLLERGASIEVGDTPFTPIHLASNYGHVGVVKLLLERGADVRANDILLTPIHAALTNGHVDVANILLLDKTTNITTKSMALEAVLANDYEQIVQLLLDSDAKLISLE